MPTSRMLSPGQVDDLETTAQSTGALCTVVGGAAICCTMVACYKSKRTFDLIVRIIQGTASEQELKKVQSEIKDDPSANHSWGCLEAFLRAIGCGDKAEKVAKLQKDAHASPKACEHSASSNLREAGRVKASNSSQHSDEVVRSQQTARLASGKGASSSGRGSSTGAQAARRSVAPPGGKSGKSTAKSK